MEPRKPAESYLLADGRFVAIDDVEAMYANLAATTRDPEELERALWRLTRECLDERRYDGAVGYLARILALTRDDQTKAVCFLETGRALEHKRDIPAAADAYSRAFTLPAQRTDTWYFLNNNLAYCLSQVGHQDEAEDCCRAAIAIEPLRHNAYKNLGVCLEAKGQLVEAARCFLQAARLFPDDPRALGHLEDLLGRHAEVAREHPELRAAAQEFRAGDGARHGLREM
jgi:tetratricopeptide (TPR) repeat protein